MSSVVLLGAREPLAQRVLACLQEQHGVAVSGPLHPDIARAQGDGTAYLRGADSIVYIPVPRVGHGSDHSGPDVAQARGAFELCARVHIAHLVLVSSAEVYGASPRNPGLIAESRTFSRDAKSSVSEGWAALEAAASEHFGPHHGNRLTILRPCAVPMRGRDDFFSRLFSGRMALTLAGHDPTIQVLSPIDLASAIACALARSQGGVYNVAPDEVIPLHSALELAHAPRVPVPRELQRQARKLWSALGLGEPESIEQLDYLRYSWTISNHKLVRELEFVPTRTSAQAVQELLLEGELAAAAPVAASPAAPRFDDFGMDKEFVASSSPLFEFLARQYWRIEVEGLEHVPAQGKGVLTGVHRGLIAWDGVMIMHLLEQRLHRIPRFLVHPAGFQFPFAFDFTTKLGGVVACQENADYVLERGELLGIFPEGLRGVFTLYREAYQLRKFGRHDFVKIALRHGAPIIPFVIVGSAETYPIVGKIDWPWWTRKTDWPYFPITPTLFPLFPAPLPSKWYVRFLPPIDVAKEHQIGRAHV